MDKVFQQLELIGILPVLTLDRADDALPTAEALVNGGLACVEVTFRTEAATEVISKMSKSGLSLLIGAGTVQSVDQAKEAIDRGARFIVSPGLNRKVVEHCIKANIPVIPGVTTPTEIEQATEYGLAVLKFFPAEASGGATFLRAISAPYKKVKFIPTGGIDDSNLLSYLKLPSVLACGGSWMVKPELIKEKKFDEIRMLTVHAVKTMLGFKLQHIGINSGSADEAQKIAAFLAGVLQSDGKDGSASIFIGSEFEVLKSKYLGDHGHIALGTNFIDRAIAFLEKRGIKTKPETRNEREGKLATIYLDVNVGGFAVHLIQI